MQDVPASTPNGVSVKSVDNMANFGFRLAYADFYTRENNKEINVESSSSGSDAAVGSTASGFSPVTIDESGEMNFTTQMQDIALNIQTAKQTSEMSKKNGARNSKSEQNNDQVQEMQ